MSRTFCGCSHQTPDFGLTKKAHCLGPMNNQQILRILDNIYRVITELPCIECHISLSGDACMVLFRCPAWTNQLYITIDLRTDKTTIPGALRDLGAVSIRKTVLLGMVIPMLKIRRPTGRLIFNMGIPIPGKTVFYIETGPWNMYKHDDDGNTLSCG